MSLTSKLVTAAAAGSGSEPDLFLLSMYGTGTSNPYFYGLDIDSSGNIVTCGNVYYPATHNEGVVVKLDPSANILLSKEYGNSAANGAEIFKSVTTDTSDNIYVVGQTVQTTFRSYIRKMTASGSLIWDKQLYSSKDTTLNDCALSSDESKLFIGGQSKEHAYGTQNGFYLGYLDASTGAGPADYMEVYSGSNTPCYAVSCDSNGYVWFGGTIRSTAGVNHDFVQRASQTGLGSFAEKLQGVFSSARVTGFAHDSSGNTWYTITVGSYSWLAKVSSVMALQGLWQFTGSGISAENITIDSNDNIYVCAYRNVSGARYSVFYKFNSSGTKIWSNQLKTSNTSYRVTTYKIRLSPDDNYLYVCGYESGQTPGVNAGLVFKFPSDGTLTGTYGNLIYEPTTFTTATFSSTPYNNASTRVTVSLTANTPSMTENTFTPSSTILYEA